MKYNLEDYSIVDSGFYGLDDGEIKNYKEKLVKCRKKHECIGGCEKEIQIGNYAIRETGFIDGEPVSAYTCVDCIDAWLDEIGVSEE